MVSLNEILSSLAGVSNNQVDVKLLGTLIDGGGEPADVSAWKQEHSWFPNSIEVWKDDRQLHIIFPDVDGVPYYTTVPGSWLSHIVGWRQLEWIG